MKKIEGTFNSAAGKHFAIVISRWNSFVTDRLLNGALDALTRHGVADDDITVAYCPGAFEIALTVEKFAASRKYDAVIALGAVIRGATPHFDYIAEEVSKGIATISLKSGIPCIFGVLTTDTIEQAMDRSGLKSGNKGSECALSAIEMVSLMGKINEIAYPL